VAHYLEQHESAAVDATFEINGLNFAGRGQSQGLVFVRFKDWSLRTGAGLEVAQVLGAPPVRTSPRISRRSSCRSIHRRSRRSAPRRASISSSKTCGGLGHGQTDRGRAINCWRQPNKTRTSRSFRPNGLSDNPNYKIDIDREKGKRVRHQTSAMSTRRSRSPGGSRYVNNFLDSDGRIKKVYVQADTPFRMKPGRPELAVSCATHRRQAWCPSRRFATGSWSYGSPKLERYNGVSIGRDPGAGGAGPKHRAGDRGDGDLDEEAAARDRPTSGPASRCSSSKSGSQAPVLYGLSILVVLLSLAALYESWSVPISVIMVVPLGILGALGAAAALHLENDVYFQVGLLTTIGLSSKNAILIVEFGARPRSRGASRFSTPPSRRRTCGCGRS